MISTILALFFYFLPLWYACSWYAFPKFRLVTSLVMYALFIEFVYIQVIWAMGMGNNLGELHHIMGFTSIIWSLFLASCILCLVVRKILFSYAVFLSVLLTIFLTEWWELPIHVKTLTINPTVEQGIKTFMLSSPRMFLVVPLTIELEKSKKVRQFWTLFTLPMLFLIPFVVLLNPFTTAKGYPMNEINLLFRLFWCIIGIGIIMQPEWIPNENSTRNT